MGLLDGGCGCLMSQVSFGKSLESVCVCVRARKSLDYLKIMLAFRRTSVYAFLKSLAATYICVCVRERERERERQCVCTHFCRALLLPIFVCVCERERVKEVDRVCVRIFVEPCCYLYVWVCVYECLCV